jgi:hypothetical protein
MTPASASIKPAPLVPDRPRARARSPLNILVLHRLGDPRYWRTAVRDLEFLLPDHAAGHHYVVHAADQPLPPYIRDLRFHGIVLGPTFLCARYARHTFAQVLSEFDFIRTSDAFKIAMPQDDYHANALLDDWMVDWGVDTVYAACADHWDVLYPKYSVSGNILQGYTSYIASAWIERWRNTVPFTSRPIDVSYRARRLPANFGRIGHIKGTIGERFAAHPASRGLNLDLSTADADVIAGAEWHAFLDRSRFCLATNTGSSVLDPVGAIQHCVERYEMRHPAAGFEEIEAHCFPGLDGRYTFTAISPRNIEAALAQTAQIATPGPYGGILRAGDHYISLDPDCRNVPDVIDQMRDRVRVERIRDDAREAVMSVPELRASAHADRLIGQIDVGAAAKHVGATPAADLQRALARYQADVIDQSERFWQKRRRRLQIHQLLVALGARKIKRWLVGAS